MTTLHDPTIRSFASDNYSGVHPEVLAAKGLVSIQTTGRTINLALTDRGRAYAARIAADPAFQPFVNRAAMLRQNIDIGATDIMKFIYRTFPEIGTLSFDETIDP